MQKRGIFIVLILMGFLRLEAQVISHKVLVPAASTFQGEVYTVSQTIGEPVVAFLNTESWDLTQGFQQPSTTLVALIPPNGNGIKVFPNPVQDYLTIEMFGDGVIDYRITVFGIEGTVYFRKDYKCSGSFWRIESLNVSDFKSGIYFVRVQTNPRKIERMFKIEKM